MSGDTSTLIPCIINNNYYDAIVITCIYAIKAVIYVLSATPELLINIVLQLIRSNSACFYINIGYTIYDIKS